jgi:uncharacterized membrane protein YfcA
VTPADIALVAGAALAAGAVNAIAGGGSLLTFPALVAVGLPTVTASVTNTVALLPGYLGATWAQRRELEGQGKRLGVLVPLAAIGGFCGGLLLLHTSESLFRSVVPFLILFAAVLLSLQDIIRKRLLARTHHAETLRWALVPVALAAAYGGYFGAGVGVIMLGFLGVVLDDNIIRLNALKQALSLSCNVAAAVFFLFSGRIDWPIIGVMAGGALVGGVLGGMLVSRIPARVLRWVIVTFAIGLAAIYLVRLAHTT